MKTCGAAVGQESKNGARCSRCRLGSLLNSCCMLLQ